MRKYHFQSGVTLIEVIVSISIIAVMVIAIGFSVTSYVNARAALLTNTKALYLAEEGYELLRAIRNDDWNIIDSLSTNTYYYFSVSTTSIAVSTSPEIIDTDFRRSFIVRDLYRNTNDDITDSSAPGAAVDSGGREVEVFVSSPTGTSSLSAILTNIFAI